MPLVSLRSRLRSRIGDLSLAGEKIIKEEFKFCEEVEFEGGLGF